MIGGDAKQRKKKSGGNSITGGSAVSYTRHNLGNSHILCNTKTNPNQEWIDSDGSDVFSI